MAGIMLKGLAQRCLVALGNQPIGHRRHQLGQEGVELRRGQQADELVGDVAVLEGFDRRYGGNAVVLRQSRVLVDVHLGEHDLARARRNRLLNQRSQLAAGSAPLRPEVDNHRRLV